MHHILKTLLCILIVTSIISCQENSTPSSFTLELDNTWHIHSSDDSITCEGKVPGTVHSALIENGLIKDPFYRLNEHDVQWIDKKDWIYATEFNISAAQLENEFIELRLKSLDTYAKVFLNDQNILESTNMFHSHSVAIKHLLKEGENTLRVELTSPVLEGEKRYDASDYKIPVSDNDLSEIGGMGKKQVSIYTRKAGYHFGWDWGPRLVSSGILEPVTIKGWSGLSLEDVWVRDAGTSSNFGTITAQVKLKGKDFEGYTLHTFVDREEVTSVPVLSSTTDLTLNIDAPKLWWPNGMGSAHLYDIKVELHQHGKVIDSWTGKHGIRSIEVVQKDDKVGASFGFEINGTPIFAKGANYIPQDVFLDRVTPERYEHIIKSAADANMNMLRVWGGGIYEKDIFYDLCDQYGILVWQDFMFACSMYPTNEAFLQSVKIEAEQNVQRLRNHACIALWSGNNEVLSAWKNWGWEKNFRETYGDENADQLWKTYENIFHDVLPQAVKDYDPDKFYWSASPSAAQGIPENWLSGDNHYWGVWWGKEPFKNYETKIPRFMSEFGFQSFPSFETVKKYTDSTDWDIYSEVMKSHQRSSIGNATIEEYLLRHYKAPEDFDQFLYVGQLLQAKGIQIGVEAHRRNWPYCQGSLYWQIDDCWPVASWSSMDYYGNWKALHYRVRDAFKPTIASFEATEEGLKLFIVHEGPKNLKGNVKLQSITFDGSILKEKNLPLQCKAGTSQELTSENLTNWVNESQLSNSLIVATIINAEGSILDEKIHYGTAEKDMELPTPKLTVKVEGMTSEEITLAISTNYLAKNLFIETQEEGHFSDNYFDLLPGKSKTIVFKPYSTEVNTSELTFSFRTLIDSY